jgi:hypothetical protein
MSAQEGEGGFELATFTSLGMSQPIELPIGDCFVFSLYFVFAGFPCICFSISLYCSTLFVLCVFLFLQFC